LSATGHFLGKPSRRRFEAENVDSLGP